MAKPRLNLRSRKDLPLADYAAQILRSMTGNPAFPDPMPPLAELQAAVDGYRDGLRALMLLENQLRAAVTRKKQSRQKLEKVLAQMAGYVYAAGEGQPAAILSAGMAVAHEGGHVGLLPAPQDLRAVIGPNEGEVILRWDAMRKARVFEIEYKPDRDAAAPWVRATPVTRSRASVKGLTPGQRLSFRVRAVATAGYGTWSDQAFCRVP